MGTDTIPDRTNGQTIVQSFFNLLKTVLKGDFVPRNSSGVAASGAGSLGTTTYPWQNSYVKSDGDYYIGSNKLIAPHDNNIKTLNANYTILDNDRYSHFLGTTGSSANITVTLPTAADNKGRRFSFCKVDSGTKYIEIAPEGSEEIRGANSSIYVTDENETLELLCDGTGYILLGNHLRVITAHFSIQTFGILFVGKTGDVDLSVSKIDTGIAEVEVNSGVFSARPVTTTSTNGDSTTSNMAISDVDYISTTVFRTRYYYLPTSGLLDGSLTVTIIGPK